MIRRVLLAFAVLVGVSSIPTVSAETHSESALIIARELDIPTTNDWEDLYGLFPAIFPGGYDGVVDFAFYDKEATKEHIVVALVRWAGWDTVNYDKSLVDVVKPYVTPEGFPYYKPAPTPRSIPYVIAAMSIGLIDKDDLKDLRKPLSAKEIKKLAQKAKQLRENRLAQAAVKPTLQIQGLNYPTNQARLGVLQPGFRGYDALDALPGSVLDLAGSEIRLFTPGSMLGDGHQTYFPLGPLETLWGVGLNVKEDNLSHQSQAIYGVVENHSSTVNAVGIWGTGKSWAHDARVWGGFLVAENNEDPKKDAQLVGLEVDVVNHSLPGKSPNFSKSGIQVVGIGSAPVSDAILIIGADAAKWQNGLLFASDAIVPDGAFIGVAPGKPVARGIDMANVRFTDSAISLGKWSAITFRNTEGGNAAVFTDDSNRLLLRGGLSGIRLMNEKSELIAEFTPEGDIITPHVRLSELTEKVVSLESRIAKLEAILANEK
jgi:hypothetical protein